MSTLHIIGVGGTGHKIVTAAVHLAACGAFKGHLGTMQSISVLTVDADDANGNLEFTKKTLSAYHNYYNAVSDGGREQLGLVPIEPVLQKVNLPLFKEKKKSLMAAFNIADYKGSDMDNFIRFLYTENEIKEEFDQGFYGHTSIGTLVINDILDSSADWDAQTKNINKDDFVVVAGSIFGGTGASSIPVLLDRLHSLKAKNNFSLAALVLNPYFETPDETSDNKQLRPDSENFNIKAKASLYYYYNQNQYEKTDALYIIGEPKENYSVENYSRGAKDQNNKASPIELFAATALLDFVINSVGRTGGGIIAAKRDYDGTNKKYLYTWEMLKAVLPELPANIQNALKMAIFYNKVLYPELKRGGSTGNWLARYNEKNKADKEDKGLLFEIQNNTYIYEHIHTYLKFLVCWFRDIHLKNTIDNKTGKLAEDKDHDDCVKLLNAKHKELFDDAAVNDPAKFTSFEKLINNDEFEKESWKIYHELNKQHPKADGKIFAELFDDIHKLISKKDKKGNHGAQKFTEVVYLSKEGKVDFAIPATNDLWSKCQAKLLEQIAEGLPVGVSKSFNKNDISIPSPWSIFITNELTLTEPNFAAINEAAFNEWCGIIALLVLRKLNHYESQGLKLEPLTLDGTVGDGEFLKVINNTLTPGSHIFANHDWKNHSRLSLDGVTIAFLAHNTLVCPVYSLDAATKGKLNIMAPAIVGEEGEFLSPDNYFKDQSKPLNKNAKSALKEFLNVLDDVITKAPITPQSLKGKLQELTKRYIEKLGTVTDNPKFTIAPAKAAAVDSVESLFNSLIHSPSANDGVALPFKMSEAISSATLVEIGKNICGKNSKSTDAAAIHLAPTLLFNQINVANIADYKKKDGRYREQDGIKLICADEILLESMVVIKKDRPDDKIFHSMRNNNNSSHSEYEIIWPLDDAFLELYPPERLNAMLKVTADNKEFTVSLDIKLDNGTHTVSKTYSIKTSNDEVEGGRNANGICWIMEKNLIPFWSLWPYAKINDTSGINTWQRYNCFCVEPNPTGTPVLSLEPRFMEDSGFTERKLQSVSTKTDSILYKKMRTLPYAFKVKELFANGSIPRGVVLLRQPDEINAGAVVWDVGIDFGTTSTTAFYNTNTNKEAQFIRLLREYNWIDDKNIDYHDADDNYLVTLCDNGESANDSAAYHEKHFIDDCCFGQEGYATIYEILDTSDNNPSPAVFDSGRIFWHNYKNFGRMNADPTGLWRDRLCTNIKWEGDKADAGKYLNQLLTQIVFHAAAKQVRAINFFFSYPTAFGLSAKNTFTNTLSSLIDALKQTTGMELFFDKNKNLLTESTAAAYYFIKTKALHRLFLCVDIGGGSTDASIWNKTGNKFQTSIHFASRDMFVEPLKRLLDKESVMNVVRTNKPEDKIYSMLDYGGKNAKIGGDKIKFLIESVLFEYYARFIERLNSLTGNDETAYKNFNYSVLLAYSGLMYYIANILSDLFLNKTIDSAPEIVLGLSGKGSKLTNWINAYCPIIYEEAENLIAKKADVNIKIKPEFSEKTAKTETARGMIMGGAGNTEAPAVIYPGAAVEVHDGTAKKSLAKDAFIPASEYRETDNLKIKIDKNLVELDDFIDFFNRIAKKANDVSLIDTNWYNGYKETLVSYITSKIENTLAEGRFEPPFILMLKVFLQVYAEEYLWTKL